MNNPTTIRRLVFFVFCLLIFDTGLLFSQDLSDLGKHKQIQISGNLSFDQMITPAVGAGSYSPAQPHSWFLSGGLNTSFLGISMPLNFSYTNQ